MGLALWISLSLGYSPRHEARPAVWAQPCPTLSSGARSLWAKVLSPGLDLSEGAQMWVSNPLNPLKPGLWLTI